MSAMQSGLRGRIAPVLLLAASACVRPAADVERTGSYTYEVEAPNSGSRTVVVEATFTEARTERLSVAREGAHALHDLEVWNGTGWSPVARRDAAKAEWVAPSCTHRCRVRYRVDLGELAAACGDEVDCARRVGDATLSPALMWLVHPAPKSDVPVTVRVHTPNAIEFLSGMNAIDEGGHTFAFRAYDLDEGSFTAFGPMRRYRVDAVGTRGPGSARVDLAIVGKARFAMPDAAMRTWVEDAAGVVTDLFGRFPVDRATVFVVPDRGEDEVTFGKVLSLAGASVVVVVGDRMPATSRRQDWVLVHEMFHLGFPTFRGEGRWLGEGLATYYEPILRARAGWTTEADVFRQFARNMPRGIATRGPTALAEREDIDSIYWGGALFSLLTDVRIRQETHGARSLDDVLRACLARGGDATRVWTVAEVVRLADTVTGTSVLSDMVDRYAAGGEQIDVDGLLAALGVDREGDGSIELDDRSPLAWVRRDLIDGARGGTRGPVARSIAPDAFPR